MSYMIGVDVGGTFTDLSVFNTGTETIFNHKLSSTPGDPSQAIVDGIRDVIRLLEFEAEEISYLAHGTTVATNALIEKKGARVGVITTQGLKDLMEIGWQKRPNLYDLLRPKAQSIIPPGLKCEVPERILSEARKFWAEPGHAAAVRARLKEACALLGEPGSSERVARRIVDAAQVTGGRA